MGQSRLSQVEQICIELSHAGQITSGQAEHFLRDLELGSNNCDDLHAFNEGNQANTVFLKHFLNYRYRLSSSAHKELEVKRKTHLSELDLDSLDLQKVICRSLSSNLRAAKLESFSSFLGTVQKKLKEIFLLYIRIPLASIESEAWHSLQNICNTLFGFHSFSLFFQSHSQNVLYDSKLDIFSRSSHSPNLQNQFKKYIQPNSFSEISFLPTEFMNEAFSLFNAWSNPINSTEIFLLSSSKNEIGTQCALIMLNYLFKRSQHVNLRRCPLNAAFLGKIIRLLAIVHGSHLSFENQIGRYASLALDLIVAYLELNYEALFLSLSSVCSQLTLNTFNVETIMQSLKKQSDEKNFKSTLKACLERFFGSYALFSKKIHNFKNYLSKIEKHRDNHNHTNYPRLEENSISIDSSNATCCPILDDKIASFGTKIYLEFDKYGLLNFVSPIIPGKGTWGKKLVYVLKSAQKQDGIKMTDVFPSNKELMIFLKKASKKFWQSEGEVSTTIGNMNIKANINANNIIQSVTILLEESKPPISFLQPQIVKVENPIGSNQQTKDAPNPSSIKKLTNQSKYLASQNSNRFIFRSAASSNDWCSILQQIQKNEMQKAEIASFENGRKQQGIALFDKSELNLSLDPNLSDLLSKLYDPDLNLVQTNHVVLQHFVLKIFFQLEFFKILPKQSTQLKNFLRQIRQAYSHYQNPFHNYNHGVTVMHTTFIICSLPSIQESLSPVDIFAIIFSALCHDVGHTGFTNSFQIATASAKALVYNDISPLQNYHASTTFEILSREENNFLGSMKAEQSQLFRRLVISNILYTDIKVEFVNIGAFLAAKKIRRNWKIRKKNGEQGSLVSCWHDCPWE